MLFSSRRFQTRYAGRARCLGAAVVLGVLLGGVTVSPALADGGPPWWVAVTLGAENQSMGLGQVEYPPDGLTAPDTIGGQACRKLLANGSGSKYLYLEVDDAYYHGAGPGVTVAVHYYSANNVTFWIEYDAADGDSYKVSTTRNTGSSGVWKKALFWLPDPAFTGGQNAGADLRIATHDENSDFYIAGIALARPLGPYVAGDDDADFTGETFSANDKLVTTTYFYWYDAYSHRHLVNGDGSDALTDHPALEPNTLSCAYLDDPNGPQVSADESWEAIEWHKRQMLDMTDAELDIAMPVYWGGTDELLWSSEGVGRMVQALDELTAEGHNPPKIGMFYDTTTLQQADDIFNIRNEKADLTTADGRNFFIKQIIDFFSLVPPKYWARIDGKPVIFLYSANYAAAYDQSAFTELDARFAAAFGGLTPYVVRETSWSGVTTDSEYRWGAALAGPQVYDTAAVGPGFDNSAVPGGGLYRDRSGGATYTADWATILATYTGNLVHVETWSEFHEATEIAASQEYGRQYIDLTQQYAAMFKGTWGGTDNAIVIDNTIPSQMYAGDTEIVSVTVKNTGTSTWSEADTFRLGAVDDSDPFYSGNRVQLPAGVTVAPGETYTFEFTMTAPATAGDYTTDWQMVHDAAGWFGEMHRETVSVSSGMPECNPPVDDQLVVNPEFAGGGGSRSGSVTGTVPAGWRAVAGGAAGGDVTLEPLAADELYPGSPPVNAVYWHAWADPNGGGSGGTSSGDAAIDLDDDALRLAIPAENRVYQVLVDARDGSAYGGTDQFGWGLQFADTSYNRGASDDPGAVFETFGIDAMSDTGGTLSVRLDTGNEMLRSVQLDNVRVRDVTDINRMVNGDFEYSDTRPVDWRFTAVAGADGSATISHDAYSGNNAVLLESTAAGGDLLLDVEPWRIPVLPEESIYVRFRAKKVSGGSGAHLRISCAHWDANQQYMYIEPTVMTQPDTSDWGTYFLSFTTTADTASINVAFRICDDSYVNTVGAYLIDDVTVVNAGFAPPLEGNILHDGDFEDIPGDGWGTEGGYPWFDLYDTISIPFWRVFAVSGAYGGVYGRSAAASSGVLGVELFRTATGQGGDGALDKDDPATRELIPAAERIYLALADAKDGGIHGGTPLVNIGIQFPGAGRGFGFDPGAQFETFGVVARSNTGGTASVRFDLGGDFDRSVYLDNARLYDVTWDTNRMVNGDFENSDIQPLNWRFATAGGAAGSATISHDAYSGNNAVLLERTNSDGDLVLDLDGGGMRLPTIGGETYRVSFAAKKVSGSADARLNLTIAQFDDSEAFVDNVFGADYDPGTGAYTTYVSSDLVAQRGYLGVAFRVLDPNGVPVPGAYLIDDVQLVADAPPPPGGGGENLLAQGDFEDTADGTTVTGHDFIDTSTIDGWRCFAVNGASASFTVTSAAASSGSVGVEYVREEDYSAPGDRVFDDDGERFELRPGLWYHAEFYVKSGNADNSDQEYSFSFPLFGCDYTGNEPGSYTGVATSTWQKVTTPLFQVADEYNGHIAWRVSGDDGAIIVAMPSVIASASSCPGDLDGDGQINLSDLAILLAHYGQTGTYADGDLNCDGVVDLSDLAILLASYGTPC